MRIKAVEITRLSIDMLKAVGATAEEDRDKRLNQGIYLDYRIARVFK